MNYQHVEIFSFFSGVGFLDLGFEKSGYEIVLVNEYNTEFMKAYKYARNKMHMKMPKYGYHNISIDEFLLKQQNLLKYVQQSKKDGLVGFIGGPPCPDFSVAGKNKGIEGDNGRLVLSYESIIINNKPDFFVFENVKGLITTKKHRIEYEKMKERLRQSGYVLIDRLNNALEYGVPQDRERIFLIGILSHLIDGDSLNAQIQFNERFDWGQQYSIKKIKSIRWPTLSPYKERGDLPCPKNILKKLTVEYWFRKNDVLNHENSRDFFKPKVADRFATICEGDVTKKSFKRLHRWRYSPTVAYGNNEVHLHPYFSRRLTVAEALALQSLPKNFCIDPTLTKSNMFKTVGNGVPYLMAKKIAMQLMSFLQNLQLED